MYSYWANTSFTNHGLRTGVFAWTVEHSFLNQYVIMESYNDDVYTWCPAPLRAIDVIAASLLLLTVSSCQHLNKQIIPCECIMFILHFYRHYSEKYSVS